MQQSRITIPSASILAINGTPVILAPAPGVGRIIIPFGLVAVLHYGGVAYANGSAINAYVGPIANAHTALAILAAFVNSGADAAHESPFLSPLDYDPLAEFENEPINLQATGAAFITGTGSLTVTLFYNTALIV